MASEMINIEMPKFVLDDPDHRNAFKLRQGTWKFDFENLDRESILEAVRRDARPRYCAETFPNFDQFHVLELGPSDGYNTAGLEIEGAQKITAIEANSDGFLKACLLKNALGLKAEFLLGDFIKYLNAVKEPVDLVYASGVLYHLTDPLDFLRLCTEAGDNLFLWTFVYDEDNIKNHEYERTCFSGSESVEFLGESFTYQKRYYDPHFVSSPKYQGGVGSFANWLSLVDVERALDLLGFQIKRMVPDSFNNIPAMNILASAKQARRTKPFRETQVVDIRSAPPREHGGQIHDTRGDCSWRTDRFQTEQFRASFVDVPSILAEWLAPFGGFENKRILDFGCGECVSGLGIALYHETSHVVGVEVSTRVNDCLPFASREIALDALPTNLSLMQMNPDDDNLPGGPYDIIFSWSVFEHIRKADLTRVVEMLRHNLNDSGLLIVQIAPLYFSSEGSHLVPWTQQRWGHLLFPDAETDRLVELRAGNDLLHKKLMETYYELNQLTCEELRTLLTGAGFVIEREYTSREDFVVPEALLEKYSLQDLQTNCIMLLCRLKV